MKGDLTLERMGMPPSYGPHDALLPMDLSGGQLVPAVKESIDIKSILITLLLLTLGKPSKNHKHHFSSAFCTINITFANS